MCLWVGGSLKLNKRGESLFLRTLVSGGASNPRGLRPRYFTGGLTRLFMLSFHRCRGGGGCGVYMHNSCWRGVPERSCRPQRDANTE